MAEKHKQISKGKEGRGQYKQDLQSGSINGATPLGQKSSEVSLPCNKDVGCFLQ